MKNRYKTLLVIILTIFLCASANASLPHSSKLLPANTFLLVDVENFSQLQTQFRDTGFYKLYKDPAMAPFFQAFEQKLSEDKAVS